MASWQRLIIVTDLEFIWSEFLKVRFISLPIVSFCTKVLFCIVVLLFFKVFSCFSSWAGQIPWGCEVSHGEDLLMLDKCPCLCILKLQLLYLHDQERHIPPDELCFPATTSYPSRSFIVPGTNGDSEDADPRTTRNWNQEGKKQKWFWLWDSSSTSFSIGK